jgi:hypothetical protein
VKQRHHTAKVLVDTVGSVYVLQLIDIRITDVVPVHTGLIGGLFQIDSGKLVGHSLGSCLC